MEFILTKQNDKKIDDMLHKAHAAGRRPCPQAKTGAAEVAIKDLGLVRDTFSRMKTHLEAQGYTVDGILIVEFLPYSNEPGNEILLGFRESDAFGPVLSFSKDGSDAEFFAVNFSPANIVLAPIDRAWSEALIRSTKMRQKYVADGKTGSAKKIVDAGVALSDLAARFSRSIPGTSRYVLSELEVNPFVFAKAQRMVVLDGYAVFEPRQTIEEAVALPEAGMDAFFRPRAWPSSAPEAKA